ncbi:hypothetical protein HQ545_07725 [Candidatus Woesearchaeota archaeon]|nr:hypothetical protein [Candidatus Woesearchaeota archaeon]
MIIKVQPDKQKSNALKKMAMITLQRLDETDTVKYPTNTLNDYYDIIHKLMEAITLAKGIKIKGEGAHKELIDYVTTLLNLSEQTEQFLQQMREYRNRIAYEGFTIHKNYIELNKDEILKIVTTLSDAQE